MRRNAARGWPAPQFGVLILLVINIIIYIIGGCRSLPGGPDIAPSQQDVAEMGYVTF